MAWVADLWSWLLRRGVRIGYTIRWGGGERVKGVRNAPPEAEDWRKIGDELNGKR